MKSVLQYKDSKSFLSDRFFAEKNQGQGITLAKFAKRFDMSGSMFKMILDGQRNLSIQKCHEIGSAFNMSFQEREYFEALVLLDSADKSQTSFYNQRLGKIKKATSSNRRSTSLNAVLSQWFLPGLLLYIVDVLQVEGQSLQEEHLQELSQKFSLSRHALEQAIRILEAANLFQFKANEKPHIVFSKVTSSTPQKAYVKSSIQEGLNRVDKEFDDGKNSVFLNHTLAISPEDLESFTQEYKTLLDKYIEAFDEKSANVIMQVNLQAFPVVKEAPVKS